MPLQQKHQDLLDYCAAYELRTGKNTPVAEVEFEFESISEEAIVSGLEVLERAKLVDLGANNRDAVLLRREGVLACSDSARWDQVARRLLLYLRGRITSERTEFKKYTWEELKDAQVAKDDTEFQVFERLIAIFLLSSGSTTFSGPPPTATWQVPRFLVKLRSIESLQQLHLMLAELSGRLQVREERSRGSRMTLAEDVVVLAGLLLKQYREHAGQSAPFFSSAALSKSLSWETLRFNSAMNVMANRRWLTLDETAGSHPFDARGFELTEEGVLAFEQAELDADEKAGNYGVMRGVVKTETLNVLFMDLSGWSKLSPSQLTTYLEKALPRLDGIVRHHGAGHVNTWGDALIATFGSAKNTAECALDVRDFFRRTPEAEGIPSGLAPRIALHVGEVIIAHNPLLNRSDVFGHAVHLAARLEPVTGKGQVYCTREFATALEAIKGMGATAHSLGDASLPKDFGTVPIFAVTGPGEDAPLRTAAHASASSATTVAGDESPLGDEETTALLRVMLSKMPAESATMTYSAIIASCHPLVSRDAIQRMVLTAAADSNWKVTVGRETVTFEYEMPTVIVSSRPKRGW